MDWYDWLLSFHVLSAFLFVGAVAVYWALVVGTRPAAPTLTQAAAAVIARPTAVAVAVGAVGTLVFGIWLAIDSDAYQVWDGWILASLVGWGIAGALGERAGRAFTKAMDGSLEDRRRGLVLHTGSSVVLLVVLILMIFKPGA